MIWFRMGANAEKQDDVIGAIGSMPFSPFGPPRSKPKRLEPSAEKCYQQSSELAADWVGPAESLFEAHRRNNRPKKAIEAGRALLKRFPDHQATLEALADLLRDQGDYSAATEMLEQALSVNPLNRNLRQHLGIMRRILAAQLTLEGKIDAAREAFQSAVALLDARELFTVHSLWAACEFKADNPTKAEELVQKAAADPVNGPATAAALFAQAVVLKLPKALKTRFEKEFKEQ